MMHAYEKPIVSGVSNLSVVMMMMAMMMMMTILSVRLPLEGVASAAQLVGQRKGQAEPHFSASATSMHRIHWLKFHNETEAEFIIIINKKNNKNTRITRHTLSSAP